MCGPEVIGWFYMTGCSHGDGCPESTGDLVCQGDQR